MDRIFFLVNNQRFFHQVMRQVLKARMSKKFPSSLGMTIFRFPVDSIYPNKHKTLSLSLVTIFFYEKDKAPVILLHIVLMLMGFMFVKSRNIKEKKIKTWYKPYGYVKYLTKNKYID